MATTIKIIGFKNSGKTTTINSFIRFAKNHNISTFTIKHDVHDGDMDQPNTDTHSFSDSGSDTVALINQTHLMIKQKITKCFNVNSLINDKYDLFLIEGFKDNDFKKIIMLTDLNKEPFQNMDNIITFASLNSNLYKKDPTIADFSTEIKRQKWFKNYWSNNEQDKRWTNTF